MIIGHPCNDNKPNTYSVYVHMRGESQYFRLGFESREIAVLHAWQDNPHATTCLTGAGTSGKMQMKCHIKL